MRQISRRLMFAVLLGTCFAMPVTGSFFFLPLEVMIVLLLIVIALATRDALLGAYVSLGLVSGVALSSTVLILAARHRTSFDDERVLLPTTHVELRALTRLHAAGDAEYHVDRDEIPTGAIDLPDRAPKVAELRAALWERGWDLDIQYCGTAGGPLNSGPPIAISLVRSP